MSSNSDRPGELAGRKAVWAKVALWTGAVIVSLTLAVIGLIFLIGHSATFQNYVLAYIDRKASDSIGGRVELRRFVPHPLALSVDLYGLTVYGADSRPTPPLLQVDHIAVSARADSILHWKWYLDSIRIDQPVVRIFSDARGVSNLPRHKGNSNGSLDLFQLGVRHAVLERGEVYFNDQKHVVEADLHDLYFHSVFDPSRQNYSGTLRYRDGNLHADSFRPIRHTMEMQFEAMRDSFHLTRAELSSGASHIVLTGDLEDWSDPRIQAHYDAVVDSGEAGRISNMASLPAGVLQASGSVEYREKAGRSAIDSIVLNGDLNSPRLDVGLRGVRASDIHASMTGIAAHYSVANGNAAVQNFHAHLLRGELTATFNMSDLGGNTRSKLTASLRGIALADLRRFVPRSAATQHLGLSGSLNADADAAWGKTLQDLVLRADADLRARLSRAGSPNVPTGILPVTGVLHGTYRAADQELALARSSFQMPETSLTMNGAISNRSSLAFQFHSSDLREVEAILDVVRSPAAGNRQPPLDLAGNGSFQGTVRGSIANPHLTGQLTAAGLHVRGTAWRLVRTQIDISPSFAGFHNADLEPDPHGHISLNASTALTHWSFRKTSVFNAEVHTSQLDLATLTKIAGLTTAGSALPVTGTLAADGSIHGTELSPMGQGSLSIVHAQVYGQPVQRVNLTFAGTGEQIHGSVAAGLAAGKLASEWTIRPQQRTYTAQMTADGIRLDKLQFLAAHNLQAEGVLSLKASGQGALSDPEWMITAGIPRLEVQHRTIAGLNLQVSAAHHVANASLVSSALNTMIHAQAKINLTGDYFAQATLDTGSIPLQPIAEVYAPSEAGDLSGNTELHATLRGPLKDKKLLEAHVTMTAFKVDYNHTIQLATNGPVEMDYANGVISLKRATIEGTDTHLELEGSIPIVGKAPVSLLLVGTVNLRIAQLFNPDIRSSGELQLNVNSHGTETAPGVEGQIQIVNASFSGGDLPVGVQQGNGVLTLTNQRLDITKFQAVVGGGTLTARGGIAYRPSLRFDLAAAAKGIRMLYPPGIREGIDADLTFTGSEDAGLLGGQVRLTDLSFTPSFDLTSLVGQFSGGIAPPPTQGFSQHLNLNLGVSSTQNLNLVSRSLSVNGTANLRVRGTAAQPVILGRINLNGGDVIFNGNRFILNGGTVEFVNPAETQPVLNVALNTTIQQYNIQMRFNGPVDQLRTNYTSDPALPSADIINLLAFGQTTEASAANPTPGDQAAESLVASQVSSQITSRVSKIAGISQLSINPVLAGSSNQGPAGATITIQQRVTGSFFVTFSTNVASTQNQIIMGQYQLSPRVAVTGTRDQNGGFAFDTILKKSW